MLRTREYETSEGITLVYRRPRVGEIRKIAKASVNEDLDAIFGILTGLIEECSVPVNLVGEFPDGFSVDTLYPEDLQGWIEAMLGEAQSGAMKRVG